MLRGSIIADQETSVLFLFGTLYFVVGSGCGRVGKGLQLLPFVVSENDRCKEIVEKKSSVLGAKEGEIGSTPSMQNHLPFHEIEIRA